MTCTDCGSTKLEITEPDPLCATCNGRRRKNDRKPAKNPRAPIRKRSKKRAAEERKYSEESKEWLKTQVCAWHGEACSATELELHHGKGRENHLLRDKRWWKALCHEIHDRVTEDSDWAVKVGLSYKRTEKI